MKQYGVLFVAIFALPLFQACEGGGYSGGWDWGHGGWHHGEPGGSEGNGHGGHEGGGHEGGGHEGGGHEGGGHGGGHHLLAMTSDVSSGVSEDSATQLANDFGIRVASAASILRVTSSPEGAQLVSQLGFSAADLSAMASYEMPSQEGLAQVAVTLGEDVSKIERITQSFVMGVKAQVTDINSQYWQACMRSGQWSTPQNLICQQTSWNGCSPMNGATSCQAAE